MSIPDTSVLGDFVLVWAPEAAQWVRQIHGYRPLAVGGGPAQVAVRGTVRHGSSPDGAGWVALADLIEGRIEDGTRALAAGAPPATAWRGRFAQVVWNPTEGRVVGIADHFSTLSLYVLACQGVLLMG